MDDLLAWLNQPIPWWAAVLVVATSAVIASVTCSWWGDRTGAARLAKWQKQWEDRRG
jgi:hypothetical protein